MFPRSRQAKALHRELFTYLRYLKATEGSDMLGKVKDERRVIELAAICNRATRGHDTTRPLNRLALSPH